MAYSIVSESFGAIPHARAIEGHCHDLMEVSPPGRRSHLAGHLPAS